jgi:hypothetical protein
MDSVHEIKYVFKVSTTHHVRILVFRESDIIKSSSSFEDVSAYKISWYRVDWRKFRIHLSSLKMPPSPYSRGLLTKVIIQIMLVGMSSLFHCTKFRLSKCNCS